MIKIEGLTPMQCKMADDMWEMSSPQAVQEYIDCLPKSQRTHAIVVRDMLIAVSLDNVPLEKEDLTQLNEWLNFIKNGDME